MLSKKIALTVREAALDKKAENPVILDVGKLTNVARFFVVMHGNSMPHVKAIADNIENVMKAKKSPVWHVEGLEHGQWVLLDFGDVLVHIFHKDIRDFYGLERLWGEAPTL